MERKLARVTKELNEKRALNRLLLRRNGGYDTFLEELRGILEAEKKKPFAFKPLFIAKSKAKAASPVSAGHKEVAAQLLSDWHLSEVVRLEDSNGINKYNSMVAANRIYELAQTTKRIIRIHEAAYPIEQLWFPVLGDMLNGTIHKEFIGSNDLSDPAAAVLVSRLLRMYIYEMLTLNIPIRVDCVVGNHPRLTEKVPTKGIAHNSYDWVVYEMLADAFKDHPSVKVYIHTGQIAQVKVYGWNYILEHGIDVSNGREEDYEDDIRALFDDPIYRQATGLKGSSFDQILIGNLHKPKFLQRTVVNGALTGQNELGQAWRLKPIPAVQNIFGISTGHVRTWQYQLEVTHVKSEKVINPFSEYTADFIKQHGRN